VNEDARDERLGEALAVPPLDDVTRRRLVRNALDAAADGAGGGTGADPPERRSWAPLVAAAAVILLVVVGFVALGGGGNDSTSDSAARKADRVPTAETPSAAADSSSGAAASLIPGSADLGDLGDLSSTAARDRARAAVAGSPTGYTAGVDNVEELLQDVADASCADSLRASGSTVVGVGSATIDGHRAAVVLTESNGTRTAHLLVFAPCALHPL
jgi:hypothetical protein